MELFKKLIRLIVLMILCSVQSHAQKVYDFNGICLQAYKEITSLKISAGEQLILQARLQNPNNLIPDFLEGYADFFVLFFNEDPTEYKIRKHNFDQRITRLNDGPTNSPFYNYCRSVAYLQKATVAIKFGERWSAGWDFRKAFSLIKENKKSFPHFLPNDMVYGPMQVITGVIPDGYKWFTNLFGLRGSVKEGMQLIKNVLNSNDPYAVTFFNEATFYYCYLLFYIQNKPDDVFQFINQRKLDVVNNHLFAYLAANLGINNKQTEYAKNIILNKNPSLEYMSTSIWDFEMAYIKIHHIELPDAIHYFEKFLQNFKGKFYVKDSYLKLSWCYYLLGNTTSAENIRKLAILKGNTDTDADKQANKEAKSGIWPNIILLKARLLNDGGYHHEALALLQGKSSDDFTKPDEKLEFVYRVARIYDDLNKEEEAIQFYLLAIKQGEHRKEYYAARANLQIANIYERQGKKANALVYFQKCLDLDDHDFKDSIDQKAKAGIARCKGD